MDDVVYTPAEIRFWKRLGIRLLRLFGVACTFAGYLNVVETLFRFRVSETAGIGWGLLGLGVPHILAANRLQSDISRADPEFAREMEPGVRQLIATSLILPALLWGFMLLMDGVTAAGFIGFALAAGILWVIEMAVVTPIDFGRMRPIVTNVVFPSITVVVLLIALSHVPPAESIKAGPHAFIAASLAWVVGLLMALSVARELHRWDRTYTRWGWLVLLAVAIPLAMVLQR